MRPFKIYGIWPQASKDVRMYVNTLPQCSPASVGLAQARPNYTMYIPVIDRVYLHGTVFAFCDACVDTCVYLLYAGYTCSY